MCHIVFYTVVPNCPLLHCGAKFSWCQIVLVFTAVPNCPGAILSSFTLRCQIALVFTAVPNCPGAKLSKIVRNEIWRAALFCLKLERPQFLSADLTPVTGGTYFNFLKRRRALHTIWISFYFEGFVEIELRGNYNFKSFFQIPWILCWSEFQIVNH